MAEIPGLTELTSGLSMKGWGAGSALALQIIAAVVVVVVIGYYIYDYMQYNIPVLIFIRIKDTYALAHDKVRTIRDEHNRPTKYRFYRLKCSSPFFDDSYCYPLYKKGSKGYVLEKVGDIIRPISIAKEDLQKNENFLKFADTMHDWQDWHIAEMERRYTIYKPKDRNEMWKQVIMWGITIGLCALTFIVFIKYFSEGFGTMGDKMTMAVNTFSDVVKQMITVIQQNNGVQVVK